MAHLPPPDITDKNAFEDRLAAKPRVKFNRARYGVLKRDDFSSNRHPASAHCWSMTPASAGAGLFRKPGSTLGSSPRAGFSGSCSKLKNDGHAKMLNTDRWDIEISARHRLLNLDLRSLWLYRDLIAMLVRRDFVALYKQTILGPLWYVLQPLLTTSIYTLVFNRIANIPTDNLPPFLFYLTGLAIWNYHALSVTRTSDVFTTSAGIFGKIYFPRLAVPLATVITNMVTFAIQLLVLCGFLIVFFLRGAPVQLTLWVFAVPLLVVQVGALALGTGLVLSALTTRFRDLSFLVSFGTQLWMYMTPIVYPFSQVPERLQWIIGLNPMTPVVEIFRKALLGTGDIQAVHVVTSICTTVILLFLGLVMFSRTARVSVDTV
jgi:lipopolysaccharide transport system permease protein